MAKTILIITAIIISTVLSGCGPTDMDSAQRRPRSREMTAQIDVATARETDLVEGLIHHRRGYQRSLEELASYYEQTGNDMKLQWARQELRDFDQANQYDYIIEAAVAGPDLRGDRSIAEADLLFREARDIEAGARRVIGYDGDELRRALDKYNELIRRYPSSDKIDDAAYHAGQIYERFRDWRLAAIYFQRAYQWNPDTPHPSRYRAAHVLDQRLARRQEALELYREALEKEDLRSSQRDFAEIRIGRLTQREQQLERDM